jgi:hypothetical protein
MQIPPLRCGMTEGEGVVRWTRSKDQGEASKEVREHPPRAQRARPAGQLFKKQRSKAPDAELLDVDAPAKLAELRFNLKQCGFQCGAAVRAGCALAQNTFALQLQFLQAALARVVV